MKSYKNIMKSEIKPGSDGYTFIYDFLFNLGKPNMIRIHISHDDMDGFGCTYVSEEYSTLPDMVECINIHKIDKINDIITTKLSEVMNWLKQQDIRIPIMMLITDIANIDTSIFDEIQQKYDFRYYIIDHHLQSQDSYYHRKNCYINTCDSASYLYMQAVMLVIDHVIPNEIDYPEKINITYPITEAISKYDTGHWGDWKSNSNEIMNPNTSFHFDKIPLSISLQLYFNYCKNMHEDVNEAGNIFVEALKVITDQRIPIEETIGYAVAVEYTNLLNAYGHFLNNVEYDNIASIGIAFNKAILTLPKPTIAYYLFNEESDPNIRGYFSFISKEYLEQRPEIDIMLMENTIKNEVQLRTAKNDINVAEIAQLNGGGGHQKAAGYPINMEDNN